MLTISFVKGSAQPSEQNRIKAPKYEWRVGVLQVGAILETTLTTHMTINVHVPSLYLNSLEHLFDDR